MIRDGYTLATGAEIGFAAKDVRRERTGIHAVVMIALDKESLAYTNCNVERDEERTRLVNAAYKRLGPVNQKAAAALKPAFDAFCFGLWARHMDQGAATMIVEPELRPLAYVLGPYIVRGGGTILFGPRGSGKTYVALLMARAAETPGGLWEAPGTRVLFVQLERSRETFGRRVLLVNRALGLDPALGMYTLVARGRTLSDVRDVVRRHVEEDGIGLVVLDSISRAGAGGLVEDKAANSVMDTLNDVAPSWLAVAHTSHEGGGDGAKAHVFGSIMFENAADVVVSLTAERHDQTLGVALQIVKANDVPPQPPEYLALEFDADGLSGVRPARYQEFGELTAGARRARLDEVAEYVGHVGEATTQEVAEACGMSRSRAAHYLAGSSRFVRLRKEGRDTYYGLRADRTDAPPSWAQ